MDHPTLDENEAGAAPSPSQPERPAARRRFGWFKRGLVGLTLLVIAAAALGPTFGGKWLRGKIESQANERVNGRVTIEDLKLSLNGKAVLVGLEVEDEAGQLVASIPRARVDVGLRSIMTGKRDISATITDAEIELVRSADGTWNFEDLVVPSEEKEPDEKKEDGEETSLLDLDLHGRIELVNASISLRSPETMLTLRDVTAGLGLDGDKRGLTIESSMSVFGGTGSAGDFGARVIVWPKAGPGAKVEELKLTGFDLGVAQELLKLVGSPLEEGSVLAGTLSVAAEGQLADLTPDAAFDFQVDGAVDDLVVDVRSGGLSTMAFDDPHASLAMRASRAALGAEPKATAELRGREGKLKADVLYDGASDVGFTADVQVDGLAASAGLEPLLARVHPVFASAQAIQGAAVDASVTSSVQVKYAAPLPMEQLAKGWAELPKAPLNGTGSLSLSEGLVEASPFFQNVLEAFGRPTNPTFDLKPLGFAVDAGRLNYTNPWTWTIQGTETNFAGSVGLGGDLDLRWVVPVTGGLAKQNRLFEAVAGDTFEVALGGTLTSPTFNLTGALTDLAQRTAKRELESRLEQEKARLEEKLRKELDEKIGDKIGEAVGGDAAKAIDEILAGKVPVKSLEETAKKALGGGQGVDALLKEADSLWGAGKRKEAGVIYSRIRKEFPFSPTYLLNKKRIKSRRNG
jgi:hypothetical protein